MDKNEELIRLSENPNTRFWKMGFSELTKSEQVFVTIWELESEVNNGGFEQYFLNSSGDNSFAVVSSLNSIGAVNAAKIVQEAVSIFGSNGPSRIHEERTTQVENLSDDNKSRLQELDDEFMLYPDNLTELLHSFVTMNRAQITGYN